MTMTVTRSATWRLLTLGLLVLVLQIPVCRIEQLIVEREGFRNQAASDIALAWGDSQSLTGPVLALPFDQPYVTSFAPSSGWVVPAETHERRHVFVLPETLEVEGSIASRVRSRGIFDVSVYEGDVAFAGEFAALELSSLGVEIESILWDEASLVVGISDSRRLRDEVVAEIDGERARFEPGAGASALPGGAVHLALVDIDIDPKSGFRFAFTLPLRGSNLMRFQPSAARTRVRLESDWPDPSFVGAYLPVMHDVRPDGFSAEWVVPRLGRGYPQQWVSGGHSGAGEPASPDNATNAASGSSWSVATLDRAAFGVSFFTAVDDYRMSHRSIKYSFLFTLLTLGFVFLLEVIAGLRLHPAQYLLVGGALVMFHLLTLSISEHIGFASAYVLSSLGVVLLVTSYASSVLKTRARAAAVAGVLSGSYGLLYVLLALQDYSLLAGSLAIFVILAAAMFATRKLDWYELRWGVAPRTTERSESL
jgi:inner membrane protein